MDWNTLFDVFRIISIIEVLVILRLMSRDAKRGSKTWGRYGVFTYFYFFGLHANIAFGLAEKVKQDAAPAAAVFTFMFLAPVGIYGLAKSKGVTLDERSDEPQ